MTTGFRLALNWIDPALLTESYDIDLWPIFSDMTGGREWMRPDNLSDVVEEVSAVEVAVTHRAGGYGTPNFTWKLRVLSPLMTNYVVTTWFPGGAFSTPVTVRTYDRGRDIWPIYWATMQRKLYKDGAEPAAGGYDLYTLSFVGCEYKSQAHEAISHSRGFL